MLGENKNKYYKSVIIILLFITFGVMTLIYLGLIIFKEQQQFLEKYQENITKDIREEFNLIRINITSINENNIESEKRLSNKIDNTNKRIVALKESYNTILNEVKKNKIESLYRDKYLTDKLKEAELMVKEGRINLAYPIYELIATEQPENKDARFYMYYTLFLKNKSDREKYRGIINGFKTLEKEGYIRKEMRDVLFYIEAEENHQ